MKRDRDDIPKNVLGAPLAPCGERPLTKPMPYAIDLH